MVDCGVDILNPIQPKTRGMEAAKLKQTFGKNIVFHGGIDTQDLLPFGTKASKEEEIGQTIKTLNKDGGDIFAAAHNIQEDVPPENIIYLFEAARKFG